MTGIVDVGGGLRCVYSSGIYDCLLDRGIKVDYCLGVSAGSANLITYIAGQRGRTLKFYRDYSSRKEYMGMGNMIHTGSFINLDYIFSTLSNEDGENPLDVDAFKQSDIQFRVAATRAADGKSKFFTNEDVIKNDLGILKASCCIPGVCKPISFQGELYFDGGVAEPIPIEKAFQDGCDKVLLVLTKPREEYTQISKQVKVVSSLVRKYPQVADLVKTLHSRCDEILKKVAELEKEGKVKVLEPADCFGMSTLTRDKEVIMKMYDQGYRDMESCNFLD